MGFPRQEYWSGLLCPPPENIFCKMRLLRKRTGLTAWIHPQYCPVPQASVRPGLKCPAHLFFLVVFLPLLLGHQASHWPLSALPRGPVWLLRVPCPDTPTGAVIIIFQKLVRVSSHLHVLGAPPFLRLQTRALATAPKLQELAELTLPRAAPDVSPPLSTLSHSPFPSWGCCLGNAPSGLVSFHPSGHFHSSGFRSNVMRSERLSAMFLHRDDLLPFFFILIIRFPIAYLFGCLF